MHAARGDSNTGAQVLAVPPGRSQQTTGLTGDYRINIYMQTIE